MGISAEILSRFYWARQRAATHRAAQKTVVDGMTSFYRSVWEDAALRAGGQLVALSDSMLEIRVAALCLRVSDNVTSLDDPVTLHMAGDKPLVYSLLSAADVPVPRHQVQDSADLAAARSFVAHSSTSCVVKPARGTAGGAGVTMDTGPNGGLLLALASAGGFCPEVLVEETIAGDNYRLLYFDGELLDVVLRRPPVVCGDGRSTVRRLVTTENRVRARGGAKLCHSLVHIDRDLKRTLHLQGLSLRAVPREGQPVRLKSVVSQNRASDNESARDRLCQDVVDVGARAAAAVGVRLAGVDIVTRDPGRALEETAGAVIEVNTTPSLYYHYMKNGGSTPVARTIVQRWAANEQ